MPLLHILCAWLPSDGSRKTPSVPVTPFPTPGTGVPWDAVTLKSCTCLCFQWHNCYIYRELHVLPKKYKNKNKHHKQLPAGDNTKAQNNFKPDSWNSKKNLRLPFLSSWGIPWLQRYKQLHKESSPEDPQIAFLAALSGRCLWAEKTSALYNLNCRDIGQRELNINLGYLSKKVSGQSAPHGSQSSFQMLISFKMLKILQINFLVLIFYTSSFSAGRGVCAQLANHVFPTVKT